ncbi:hypothetical protein DUNSADRAFT_11053 [Dunaliella salina]|uniref:N-acetyltransferase domain-containing protein n=1 Tax=Dunaliella salina TaxID=3046 RepID=A0ABQ7GE75_DUNSA|nr:hypothetical protein DUNSADRAFT_11053 [Dunaliella salina]|eukprot:KAF5832903.1 hypothetical protein DUNSADRAFT_11053 [Dunaliella salina]
MRSCSCPRQSLGSYLAGRGHKVLCNNRPGPLQMASIPTSSVPLAQTAAQPRPQYCIRDCVAADVDQIKDICKDVYGGGDYMPRRIEEYLGDEQCLLIVADKGEGEVDGVACASLRGSMIFIFGLRVRTTAREKGLGRLLMVNLTERAKARFPHARTLASTTASSNQSAQKILGALLGAPLPQLDIWPPTSKTPHLSKYEASIGWPAKKADKDQTLLAFIPGASDILQQDGGALNLLPSWQTAHSMDEVQHALTSLRNPTGPVNGAENTHAWLPFFYEIWPAHSEFTAAAIGQQRLWILRREGCVQGVVVLSLSPECRRYIAGIVASDPQVIHSALLLTERHEPHFIAVIDRLQMTSEPEIYKTTQTVSDCLPYLKMLH